MKRELQLADIVGYLPYRFIGRHPSGAICVIDIDFVTQHGIGLAGYKPVLRPLSDLGTKISDSDYAKGVSFYPIHKIGYSIYSDPFSEGFTVEQYDFLHCIKIDYRGLIGLGLAVDAHELKRFPYK